MNNWIVELVANLPHRRRAAASGVQFVGSKGTFKLSSKPGLPNYFGSGLPFQKLTRLLADNPPAWRGRTVFEANRSAREGTQMFPHQATEIVSDETLSFWFESEYRTLVKVALRITRDVDDAHDAVQTTFLRACECANSLTPEHIRGWLRVVVRRVAIDIVRARSKSPCADQLELSNIVSPPKEPEPHWMTYSFDDLDRALLSCPAPIRNVFRLWWSGLSYRLMAQKLSVPAATIATRVLRAKSRIRNYYRTS